MENLTLSSNLVQQAQIHEARPGYRLVIYEEASKGWRYVETVEAGQVFRPSMVQRFKTFKAWRVSADPQLTLVGSRKAQTQDQLYSFTLHLTIHYGISHPERLIDNLDRDPLSLLRDRALEGVLARVWDLPWSVIEEGGQRFRLAADSPLDHGGQGPKTTLAELRDFADIYGLEVRRLDVARSLSEDELVVGLTAKKTQREKLTSAYHHEVHVQETQQATHLKMLGLMDHFIDDFREAVKRSSSDVKSFPELQRALLQVQQIREQMPLLMAPESRTGPSVGSRRLLDAAPATGLPEPSFAGETELQRLVWQVEAVSHELEAPLRWQFLGLALQALAEGCLQDEELRELGDGGDGAELRSEETVRGLDELLRDLGSTLDRRQITFVRSLMNRQSLASQLRQVAR